MTAFRRTLIPVVVIALAMGALLPRSAASQPRYESYEGFTLNSYDVIDAVMRIRRSRFLLERRESGPPRVVTVESAFSEWVGYEPDAFENHRNRYTIVLNGEPIDWDSLYIEYGGEMVSLRLLYTYRNQRPIPEIPYRLR